MPLPPLPPLPLPIANDGVVVVAAWDDVGSVAWMRAGDGGVVLDVGVAGLWSCRVVVELRSCGYVELWGCGAAVEL